MLWPFKLHARRWTRNDGPISVSMSSAQKPIWSPRHREAETCTSLRRTCHGFRTLKSLTLTARSEARRSTERFISALGASIRIRSPALSFSPARNRRFGRVGVLHFVCLSLLSLLSLRHCLRCCRPLHFVCLSLLSLRHWLCTRLCTRLCTKYCGDVLQSHRLLITMHTCSIWHRWYCRLRRLQSKACSISITCIICDCRLRRHQSKRLRWLKPQSKLLRYRRLSTICCMCHHLPHELHKVLRHVWHLLSKL